MTQQPTKRAWRGWAALPVVLLLSIIAGAMEAIGRAFIWATEAIDALLWMVNDWSGYRQQPPAEMVGFIASEAIRYSAIGGLILVALIFWGAWILIVLFAFTA